MNMVCRTWVTRVLRTWVLNVGILPENKTHVLKTWVFLDTMKPTFRGGMKGRSNLFILFRKAPVIDNGNSVHTHTSTRTRTRRVTNKKS